MLKHLRLIAIFSPFRVDGEKQKPTHDSRPSLYQRMLTSKRVLTHEKKSRQIRQQDKNNYQPGLLHTRLT